MAMSTPLIVARTSTVKNPVPSPTRPSLNSTIARPVTPMKPAAIRYQRSPRYDQRIGRGHFCARASRRASQDIGACAGYHSVKTTPRGSQPRGA